MQLLCVPLCSTLLDYLRASLFEGCMEVYAELLEEMQGTGNADPLQNCALQLWFDVRYLSSLLTSLELPADKVIGLVLPMCLSCCHMWSDRITMGRSMLLWGGHLIIFIDHFLLYSLYVCVYVAV